MNELGDLKECESFANGCETCVRIGVLLLMACYVRHHNDPILLRTIYSQRILPLLMLWTLCWLAAKEYDAAIGDVTVANENAPLLHKQPQYRRFADFLDNRDCVEETGFEIQSLVEMLNCFGLPESIYVDRGRRDGKRYKFHREELLIYTLMQITSGTPHNRLSKRIGQKCDSRMGRGYHWLIAYLDNRYDRLIGSNGIRVWLPYFPHFAEQIRQYVSKDYICQNPLGHFMIVQGVWFNPGTYNVAGFVDCKDYEFCTPHSGPAAPEPGAPRRPWWYEFQRAVFGGHHRTHAVKMITFMIPNGLYAAVWGPASARRGDSLLVHWSEIDNILFQMQRQYFHTLYTFFGDVKFRVGRWRCIRGRHAVHRNGPWANARERAEDQVMNRTRETIEHSYSDEVEHFHALLRREQLKMGNNPIYMLQMIRVCHLFYNLRVCANGNVVSSPNALNCKPPTITQYLNM